MPVSAGGRHFATNRKKSYAKAREIPGGARSLAHDTQLAQGQAVESWIFLQKNRPLRAPSNLAGRPRVLPHRRRQQRLLGRLAAREFTADPAFM